MAFDVLQFVDSVSATAALRLDLNDGVTWGVDVATVDFSPPPLRRAINGTLLVDGSTVSASSYDNRLLKFSVQLVGGTVDLAATQAQLLSRELDRDGNYLKWQPVGATSPVFFRTIRSSTNRVGEVPSGTFKTYELEILAEPFALGLREDVAVGTVNNDPAAGANGNFFDVTGVKGDVAAPAVIYDATSYRTFGVLACRQHGTPANFQRFAQAESVTLGTDTTNPGGGPDAAMSGATLNNFVRTSFATATMVERLRWSPGLASVDFRGTFRIFAVVRRSDLASVITVACAASVNLVQNAPVTVPATSTARQVIDLGLLHVGEFVTNPGRYGADSPAGTSFVLYAARASGAGSLDWDCIYAMPADEQMLLWDTGQSVDGANGGAIDGYNEVVFTDDGAGTGLFNGTRGAVASASAAGGFPTVKPNQTNRFCILWTASPTGGAAGAPALLCDKTKAGTITVSYWPRYLYARPATT